MKKSLSTIALLATLTSVIIAPVAMAQDSGDGSDTSAAAPASSTASDGSADAGSSDGSASDSSGS